MAKNQGIYYQAQDIPGSFAFLLLTQYSHHHHKPIPTVSQKVIVSIIGGGVYKFGKLYVLQKNNYVDYISIGLRR